MNTPDAFLKDDFYVDDDADSLPVGKLADPGELLKLARRWDQVGRVTLFRRADIDPRDIADCFPVLKEGTGFPGDGIDRQIIDRRRRNAREKRLQTGSKTMPHAALVNELFLGVGQVVEVSIDDP